MYVEQAYYKAKLCTPCGAIDVVARYVGNSCWQICGMEETEDYLCNEDFDEIGEMMQFDYHNSNN